MSYLDVNAEDVKVGDSLYMGEDFARNTNMWWARVCKVKSIYVYQCRVESVRIWIVAGDHDFWLEPHKMISVQRCNNEV